jgi:hypothetical protein
LSFLDDAIAAQPTVANRKSVLQSDRLFRHCQVNATEITLNRYFDKKSAVDDKARLHGQGASICFIVQR